MEYLESLKKRYQDTQKVILFWECFWIGLRVAKPLCQWPILVAVLTIKFKWFLLFDPLWDQIRCMDSWTAGWFSGFNAGAFLGSAIATVALCYRNRLR